MSRSRTSLLATLALITIAVPQPSVAEDKIEGKVVHTNLTLCHPKPGGGGCEGTLTLETTSAGSAQKIAIKVIADTIIKKGRDVLFLPATQGNSVVVTYTNQKGQKVAKSINVVETAR